MQKNSEYKLKNFFASFGAAVHLSTGAKRKNNYLEMVCLYANIIDGILRLTLVFKEQIDNNTDAFDEKLLFQDLSDKPIMEKDIYKRAVDKKIITKAIYKKLFRLYDQRNKIIHRYIISDLKTIAVKKTAIEYDKLTSVITERHRIYDTKIKTLNIGIGKKLIRNPTIKQMVKQILPKHKGLLVKKSSS